MSPTQSGPGHAADGRRASSRTSIAPGQLMSRTGRYKIFPIIGAATVIVALLLLSQLDVDTPYWHAGAVDVRLRRRPRLHHADHRSPSCRTPSTAATSASRPAR